MVRRRAALAAGVAGPGALAPARVRLRDRGATPAERAMPLPGDHLVRGGTSTGTMATTIDAPPAAIWPWLAQMGCDRAGFYSWNRLDNGGRPSAERLHPEWQDLRRGDRVRSTPADGHWFDVELLEPERTLVLRAVLAVPSGRSLARAAPLPRWFSDSTWGFHLRPAGAGTRLLVRGWSGGRPHALLALGNALFWEPAHWLMQARQFAGLRRRARATAP